jgi:hypothetical protein
MGGLLVIEALDYLTALAELRPDNAGGDYEA